MQTLVVIRRVLVFSFIIFCSGTRLIAGKWATPAEHNAGESSKVNIINNSGALRGGGSNEESGELRQFHIGLAVAHCEEPFLARWIDEVDDVTLHGQPIHWDVSVYERCGQQVSPKYSTFQRNLGSEECTAYLKYIVDRYEALPEMVYFLQPDALSFNTVKGHQHTNFSSLSTLVAASAPLMTATSFNSIVDTEQQQQQQETTGNQQQPNIISQHPDQPLGFLNLGNMEIDSTRLVTPEGPNNNPVEILQYMEDRAPTYDDESYLELVPGACFVVRRERILAQPLQFYKELILQIAAREDEAWTCFSLEATWHVIFGEPLAIPPQSTLMHHLEQK